MIPVPGIFTGKKTRFFTYLLLVTLLCIVLVGTAITIADYQSAKETAEANYAFLQKQTEQNLIQSVLIIETGYSVQETSTNERLRTAFVIFLDEYERAGRDPSAMDPERLKSEIGGPVNLYLIDGNRTVRYLSATTSLGISEPDTARIEKYTSLSQTGPRNIYSVGRNDTAATAERSLQPYQEYLKEISYLNPHVREIAIFGTDRHLVANFSRVTGPAADGNLDQVITTRAGTAVDDPETGIRNTYLYIELPADSYGSDRARIIRVTYDSALIHNELTRLLFLHLLAGITAMILCIILAVLVTQYLVRPLNQLTADVNAVAKGDLSHPVSPVRGKEFQELGESVGMMVATIKEILVKERESARRLQMVIDTLDDLYYQTDMQGIILNISSSCEKLTGFKAEDLIGTPVLDHYQFPEQRDALLKDLFTNGAVYDYEVVLRHRDGHSVPSSVSSHIVRDGEGKPVAIEGIIRDITRRKTMELALRGSREKYRELVENLDEVIFSVDRQGHLSYVSPVIRRKYGYTPDEVTDRHILEFIHPDDHAACIEWFRKRLAGNYDPEEFRLLLKNNQVRHVSVAPRPIEKDGIVIGFNYVMNDITERKRIETALLESEEKFRGVAERSSDLILMTDSKGTIVYVSPSVKRILGYDPGELLAKSATDIIHPDDLSLAEEGFRKNLSGNVTEQAEIRIRTRDGTYAILDIAGVPVMKQGAATGIQVIGRDITERKRTEEALKESEERFRSMIEFSPVVIFTLRYDGRDLIIASLNPAFEKITGYECRDWTGKPIRDIVHPEDLPLALQNIANATSDGVTGPFNARIRSLSGDFLIGEFYLRPWLDERGSAGILGIAQNVTGRVLAQQALREFNEQLEKGIAERTASLKTSQDQIRASLEEKEVLLREIHHRVKNNLQIIISLTNLQMRQTEDPDVQRIMAETQNRVRAMALVHEKLYRSEILSQIDFTDYTRYLATQLLAFYSRDARRVNLEITMEKIMLDINTAVPLGLVMNELVSNALKHAFPAGRGGTISISGREETDHITITVGDNGVGIPADLDWRIVDSLGLRLVTSLVDQLGGTIDLASGKGAVFTIVVPKKRQKNSGT